jgi:hypothetical protein
MHNLWPLIMLGLVACGGEEIDTGEDTGIEDTATVEETGE